MSENEHIKKEPSNSRSTVESLKGEILLIPKAADTEEVFNNLDWEAVEDTSVNSILEGKTIVGVELVGYPLTEGTLIYFREADGRLWVLESLVSDSCFFEGSDTADEENPLIFNKARFPAGI